MSPTRVGTGGNSQRAAETTTASPSAFTQLCDRRVKSPGDGGPGVDPEKYSCFLSALFSSGNFTVMSQAWG